MTTHSTPQRTDEALSTDAEVTAVSAFAAGDTGSAGRIVLGSASPRRAQLLASLGVESIVDPPDIDETPHDGESAVRYVGRLAAEKAAAVAARHAAGTVVIAADTTVAVDGEIFGKPADADDVRRMLRRLSGRSHEVHTGVAVIGGLPAAARLRDDNEATDRSVASTVDAVDAGVPTRFMIDGHRGWVGVGTTAVVMETLAEPDIEWYLATGEPFGKAGAYALQGSGGVFIARIEGSVSNVIGLPMTLLRSLARRQGIELLGSHHNRLGHPDFSV